eukprot:scaffold5387_cov251-Ochromonas_danica.AAC.22
MMFTMFDRTKATERGDFHDERGAPPKKNETHGRHRTAAQELVRDRIFTFTSAISPSSSFLSTPSQCFPWKGQTLPFLHTFPRGRSMEQRDVNRQAGGVLLCEGQRGAVRTAKSSLVAIAKPVNEGDSSAAH